METKRISQTIVVDAAEDRVLLAYHKQGKFGGSYIGFLDYLAAGEEPDAGAVRIPRQQCGITVDTPDLRALLTFTADDYGVADEYEFYAGGFSGEPEETEHIKPVWFGFDQIPYQQMPADDAIWYPFFLQGKILTGKFHYNPGMEVLMWHNLYEVDCIPEG